MHDEKIWALDMDQDRLVTGGGDGSLKLWTDNTKEMDLEQKEQQIKKLEDEQALSNLMREEEFLEAALLSFKMNKLRNFYVILNKVLKRGRTIK